MMVHGNHTTCSGGLGAALGHPKVITKEHSYPAVPRHSFAHRFAHIFAHIFFKNNEFQKYFSARRNIFDLTQNSVVAVLTVSNLIMIRTYVFR